ncbi:MAG TPA: hypothetical protein VM737_02115 [Gemmatimonadota bacterium]|nr:hypothetical protein [Gemmatimonadota bacterium]
MATKNAKKKRAGTTKPKPENADLLVGLDTIVEALKSDAYA